MTCKRYIACLLLAISALMPIIPVIPHHHHADGHLCMKNDITADCCGGHHHDQGNGHCCGDDCVTMHFFEQTPGSDDTWHFSFEPEEVLLFLEQIADPQLLYPDRHPKQDTPYIERLHGTLLTRAAGLRAPPSQQA